jgi:hypothetical protein
MMGSRPRTLGYVVEGRLSWRIIGDAVSLGSRGKAI